jgi:hypothetical protein
MMARQDRAPTVTDLIGCGRERLEDMARGGQPLRRAERLDDVQGVQGLRNKVRPRIRGQDNVAVQENQSVAIQALRRYVPQIFLVEHRAIGMQDSR